MSAVEDSNYTHLVAFARTYFGFVDDVLTVISVYLFRNLFRYNQAGTGRRTCSLEQGSNKLLRSGKDRMNIRQYLQKFANL